jgi:hypothetical protein
LAPISHGYRELPTQVAHAEQVFVGYGYGAGQIASHPTIMLKPLRLVVYTKNGL